MGKIQGLDKLQKRLNSVGSAKARRLIEGALFSAADLVATEAGLSITRGAQSGKNHVVSAPGQAPNADTHVLDRNIGVHPVANTKGGNIEVTVQSLAPYSEALEFGTSKMAARPFFRPARDKKRGEAKKLVQAAVNKIIAGGAE